MTQSLLSNPPADRVRSAAIHATADAYSIEIRSAQDALADTRLVERWDNWLASLKTPRALYASSEWLRHLLTFETDKFLVCVIEDSAGQIAGVVPVRLGVFSLKFDVVNRVLYRHCFRAAHILGGNPLVPDMPGLVSRVYERLLEACPSCDGLYFEGVPTWSPGWRVLSDPASRPDGSNLYIADGPTPWHRIDLAESFEAFEAGMGRQTRQPLRRMVRVYEKKTDGRLELTRISEADQVPEFLDAAVAVSRESWQHRVLGERINNTPAAVAQFQDAAQRGLLRSYLLRAAGQPVAFAVAYQAYDNFHYTEVGFDEREKEHSPGTVLLHMALNDLHTFQRPKAFDFGLGDAQYKRRFGNRQDEQVTCILLRRSFKNRCVSAVHGGFLKSIELAKRLIGRKVTK
jgi:hypothetical protein